MTLIYIHEFKRFNEKKKTLISFMFTNVGH
jgi:hypothetical protein